MKAILNLKDLPNPELGLYMEDKEASFKGYERKPIKSPAFELGEERIKAKELFWRNMGKTPIRITHLALFSDNNLFMLLEADSLPVIVPGNGNSLTINGLSFDAIPTISTT